MIHFSLNNMNLILQVDFETLIYLIKLINSRAELLAIVL